MSLEGEQIYKKLQDLIGLHRQMLEIVRLEKQALIENDLDRIQDLVTLKSGIITTIAYRENERKKIVKQLSETLGKDSGVVNLKFIIEREQELDLQAADKIRNVATTLKMIIDRINKQNNENKELVNSCLKHVAVLKNNVLGGQEAQAEIYTGQGKKVSNADRSYFLSREA